MTLIGIGHDLVGNEFTSLRLRQSFFDGRARFIVQVHNGRLFTRDRKECARKRILIVRRKLTILSIARSSNFVMAIPSALLPHRVPSASSPSNQHDVPATRF
jgi:hypothetical protein